MKITKIIAVGCFFALFTHCCAVYVWPAAEEKVIMTSRGKVISGLNEEAALKRFGTPTSVKGRLWYYARPENFYVYLTIPLTVYLYPRFSQAEVRIPLELKVLKSSEDSELVDVTALSKLIFNEPGQFDVLRPGVVVPKKDGRFMVIATYKDAHSDPAYITVSQQAKDSGAGLKVRDNLDIFPYNPVAGAYDVITFSAFATTYSDRNFDTEEISNKAKWFMQRPDGYSVNLDDSRVKFEKKGRYTVFCRFEKLESLPLEVEIRNKSSSQERIRHFAVIPGYVSAKKGDTIAFRAILTYEDNATEDVTSNVYWEAADKNILVKKHNKDNIFSAESIGATGVIARLANRVSAPVKIVVGIEKSQTVLPEEIQPRESSKKPNELLKDIKGDIEQLKQKAAKEPVRIKDIKLVPEYLKVALGQDGRFKAICSRSDNTETDITLFADWYSADGKVSSVWKGKASSYSMGKAEIYVSYKGVESQRAAFIVEEPKLVSIAVEPANLEVRINEKANLKAQGYYTDSSRKDITSLVSWDVNNPKILAVSAGVVNPLRIGAVRVYAEYAGIKSPPLTITILRQKFWLLKLIARIAILIFGLFLAAFISLYSMTVRQKKKMISLQRNTRDFIICLYGNLCKILDIFGTKYSNTLPPLSYAQDVERRYAISDKLFFKITEKFEEAKYSAHILDPGLSGHILEDYNSFLRVIISQEKKPILCYRYCLALIGRIPLEINPKGYPGKKTTPKDNDNLVDK